MKTKEQIIAELNEVTEQYNKDAELGWDSDEKLPCCDFRELETRMNVLTWVLA